VTSGLASALVHSRHRLRIRIVTPAPPGSRYGNRVTAVRWARILRSVGHRVSIAQEYEGEPADLLIALHARRSYPAVRRFLREQPGRPVIVALTGTDLYRDLPRNRRAQESLERATRIVALQPMALRELKASWRAKTRVICQSVAEARADVAWRKKLAPQSTSSSPRDRRTFDVCVVGHLRAVKDPFRAALAARRLPSESRIRILQMGGAMTRAMATRARAEMRVNPRYHWLGELTHRRVWRALRRSRLLVLSSKLEGGANILSEAIVAGLPVLASRIPGSVGILGKDYPGYFEVGDTAGLARLLARAERDVTFVKKMRRRCRELRPLFRPAHEAVAWKRLLNELS
jgi:putative glycosyltransferase (TIGR04348 family)